MCSLVPTKKKYQMDYGLFICGFRRADFGFQEVYARFFFKGKVREG